MGVDIHLKADGDLPDRAREVAGLDLTAQRVQVAIGIFRGEWFRDSSVGLPWAEWVTQKPARVGEIGEQIRAAIVAVDGVAAVTRWDAVESPASYSLAFSGDVLLSEGAVIEVQLSATPDREGLTMTWRPLQLTGII